MANIQFERDNNMEQNHKYHRYYQVVKYNTEGRYIPKFNKYTRKHTVCIYKEYKDNKSWVFWCSDNLGSNYYYCDNLTIAKQEARKFARS